MTTHLKTRWLLAVLSVATASDSVAALECVGVLQSGGCTYVALQAAPREPAVWVPLGGRFGVYTVARFDRPADVAVLVTAGGVEQELPLGSAVVRDGGAALAPKESASPRTIHLLARAAYQLWYDTGVTDLSGAMLVGTLGPSRAPEIEDASGWRVRISPAGNLAITDAAGASVDASDTGPVHVLVEPGLSLAAIARKVGSTAEQLTELNPEFVNPAGETMRRTVRIR